MIKTENYEGKNRRNGFEQKAAWAIVSTLFSIILLGGGAWVTTIYAQVFNNTQKISGVEAHLNSIDGRLARIENMIDRTNKLLVGNG